MPFRRSVAITAALAGAASADGRLVVSGRERAVVVAVIVVRMVQVTRDDVIDVIAVPYGLVTALRIVPVLSVVPGAVVVWRAAGGVGV
jgi:hypothetical protein